jgi:hypothetical protein
MFFFHIFVNPGVSVSPVSTCGSRLRRKLLPWVKTSVNWTLEDSDGALGNHELMWDMWDMWDMCGREPLETETHVSYYC